MITQLTNAKGKGVANQIVIAEDKKTTFQSYNSNIVMIDNDAKSIAFGKDYRYSTTTIRHRNKFLSDCLGVDIKTKDVDKMLHDGNFGNYTVNYNENL